MSDPSRRGRAAVLGALTLLYAAQGIPFGFAAEYLPVLLRQQGYTRTQIAALFWLQLPWQLKPLWATAADHPRVRPRARGVLLALQFALALTMAGYSLFDGSSLAPWMVLTAIAAFVAATQDIFVDAFAVRSLSGAERGLGNSAQIAGYRVGIIVGGGGMLLLSARLGTGVTSQACAALIAAAAVGAFALRGDNTPTETARDAGPFRAAPSSETSARGSFKAVLRRVFSRDTWGVFALALTFKLGAHIASTLIKPMLVDAGWSARSIGAVVVTVGTGSAVLGAVLGGIAHRVFGERRALWIAAGVQGVTLLPLVWIARSGATATPTAVVIALEHGASGLGTTVLFAALMSATWKEHAGLHYTLLTSTNALAIGLGGLLGAKLGDAFGAPAAYLTGGLLCFVPWALLPLWTAHSQASAREG